MGRRYCHRIDFQRIGRLRHERLTHAHDHQQREQEQMKRLHRCVLFNLFQGCATTYQTYIVPDWFRSMAYAEQDRIQSTNEIQRGCTFEPAAALALQIFLEPGQRAGPGGLSLLAVIAWT